MKKSVIVTLIVCFIIGTGILPAKTVKKIKHEDVKAYMYEYFSAFNQYAQDAATIDKMDKYWAPEFIAVQYLPLPQYPVMDLVTWKQFMVFVHLNILETLNVDELSIDTENLTVTARLNISFNDRASGALVLNIDALAFYNLKVDKKKNLQITTLRLYFADPYAVMALSGPPPAQ